MVLNKICTKGVCIFPFLVHDVFIMPLEKLYMILVDRNVNFYKSIVTHILKRNTCQYDADVINCNKLDMYTDVVFFFGKVLTCSLQL